MSATFDRTQAFCTRFGLRIPILLAPMAGVAAPALSSAVANAGGMGSCGVLLMKPEEIVAWASEVRSKSNGAFQLNIWIPDPAPQRDADAETRVRDFLGNWGPAVPATAGDEPLQNFDAQCEAMLTAGPPIVSSVMGLYPPQFVARLKERGIAWFAVVTTVAEARAAEAAGADAIIAQGMEAGGHVQSNQPLLTLLPQIVAAAAGLPVVAAGGIADGEGIAHALRLGAAGAMLGTRFVATQESRAHPDYKARLVAAQAEATALTVCFDGDWPYAAHRMLRNSTLEQWEAAGSPPVGARPGEGDIVGTNADGEPIRRYADTAPRQGFTGDIAAMCQYAGAGCAAIHDIPSAAELLPRLWQETRRFQ